MKIIYTFLFYVFALSLSSQRINGKLHDKQTNDGFEYVHVFIVDPVDASIISYTTTDFDGYFHINEFLQPLKSKQYQIKIADTYLPDTSFIFENDNSFRWLVLDPLKAVDWVTVQYNNIGRVNYSINLDFDEWVYSSYANYVDSATAKLQRFNDSLDLAESIEWDQWEKESSRIDSLNKISEIDYEIGPPPASIYHEVAIYDQINLVMSSPSKGWENWLDRLLKIPGLKPVLRSHRSFYLEFTMEKMEISGNPVEIFNSNGKMIKLPKNVFTGIRDSQPEYWELGVRNGRLFTFNRFIKYRIHFIYQE